MICDDDDGRGLRKQGMKGVGMSVADSETPSTTARRRFNHWPLPASFILINQLIN